MTGMGMKKISAILVVGVTLLLAGCSAPVEDDRRQRAVDALDALATTQVGESISEAYRQGDIYTGIVDDLMESCGSSTMPYSYASQIPDLRDSIVAVYSIACPG